MDEKTKKAIKARIAKEAASPVHKMEVFRYDMKQNKYWNIETGDSFETGGQVDAGIPHEYWPESGKTNEKTGQPIRIKPSVYMKAIGSSYLVDNTIWHPAHPKFIHDYSVEPNSGELEPNSGYVLYNTYRPLPELVPLKKGSKVEANNLWVQHVKSLWPTPEDHNYLFDYCAHMIQRPEEKCNNIVTLSGAQGIGKDTVLIPIRRAVHPSSREEISPDHLMGNFNTYIRCVLLIINEMRPTKEDFHASSIYEKLKTLAVTPPDMIRMSKKFHQDTFVYNVMRIIITTNDMTAMFVHPDDRRMSAILHSTLLKDWQPHQYFVDLINWLERRGGINEVLHWLKARDISAFRPKEKARSTAGFAAVVAGWGAPDDAVTTALESLRHPRVFFPTELLKDFDGADEVRSLMKKARLFQHRLRQSGYIRINFDPERVYKDVDNDRTLKFKYGFVKGEMLNDIAHYNELFDERGRLLACGVAVIGTPQNRKEND